MAEKEFLDNHLIKSFDEEGKGTIAWNNNEFLLLVALVDVVDVTTVCEAFFMAGFKVFDQVRHQYSIINNSHATFLIPGQGWLPDTHGAAHISKTLPSNRILGG